MTDYFLNLTRLSPIQRYKHAYQQNKEFQQMQLSGKAQSPPQVRRYWNFDTGRGKSYETSIGKKAGRRRNQMKRGYQIPRRQEGRKRWHWDLRQRVKDGNYLTGMQDRVQIQPGDWPSIIKIISPQFLTMINEDAANASQDSQVYGFLCQKTNVFYAFESHETYQKFLQWLSTQEVDNEEAGPQVDGREEAPMVDEATQLADFDMATREIMGVFEDPAFGTYNYEVELQEIDF